MNSSGSDTDLSSRAQAIEFYSLFSPDNTSLVQEYAAKQDFNCDFSAYPESPAICFSPDDKFASSDRAEVNNEAQQMAEVFTASAPKRLKPLLAEVLRIDNVNS